MRIGTYKYQREHIRVTRIGHMSGSGFGVRGLKVEQNENVNKNGNMKRNEDWKHET